MRKLSDILAEKAKREEDDRDLTSRSDLRKARLASETALIDLARKLTEISSRQLDRLDLGSAVLDPVLEARSITSAPALARALKRVRVALREVDERDIQRWLDAIEHSGQRFAPAVIEMWRDRIASDDSGALAEFLTAFPSGDRQRLRTLARNLSRSSDATRPKALAALTRAVREAMSAPQVEAPQVEAPQIEAPQIEDPGSHD